MSALTKVFVMLQVILSIVLATGMVVYVNRADDFNKSHKNDLNRIASLQHEATRATADAADAAADRDRQVTVIRQAITSKQAELASLQTMLADRDKQLAELQNNVNQLTAANKSNSDALQVAQTTLQTQSTQFSDLRKQSDELARRNTEQQLAISSMTNRYQVTESQRRNLAEQLTQAQGQIDQMNRTLKGMGYNANNPPSDIVAPNSDVAIRGEVQDKKVIGGVTYATINVGSAEAVTKGMQFKVVDLKNRAQPYLGTLTVDRVEAHQAVGRLDGPNVNAIRAGVEVRTQL